MGAGLLREGLLEPAPRRGAGLGSPSPVLCSVARLSFPIPCIVRSPLAGSAPLGAPVRSTGRSPWPHDFRWGGPFGHRSPGYSFLFVKRPGGRAGRPTLRWPAADVLHGPLPLAHPPWPRGDPPARLDVTGPPYPLLAGVCWCASRWRH